MTIEPCSGCHARYQRPTIANANIKVTWWPGADGKCQPTPDGPCEQTSQCNLKGVVTVTSGGPGFRLHPNPPGPVVVVDPGKFASVAFDIDKWDCGAPADGEIACTICDVNDQPLGNVMVRCGGC